MSGIDGGGASTPVVCGSGTKGAFLVSEAEDLYAFDTSSRTASKIGHLSCPAGGASPFSMAVKSGAAYVLYSTGDLFRVGLDDLDCVKTPFVSPFVSSLIGVAADISPASLLLYGPRYKDGWCPSEPTLARLDLTTFAVEDIGPITPYPNAGFPLELKVDAYGRAFALDAAGTLLMIDRATGLLIGRDETGILASSANALLPWNDELYAFTQDQGFIDAYDLALHQRTRVGVIGEKIVGAGAEPCFR